MAFWAVGDRLVVLGCALAAALGALLFLGYQLAISANRQTLYFSPSSEAITNPLMGWAPWATIPKSAQPFTLVYMDLTWRELEAKQGVYDFAGFEKKQQLARWRTENKRVVFRFVLDRPGKDRHMDIPDWLFAEIQGDGDYYSTAYGKGFSPNYANPVLIQRHQEAIRALGERYGKDDFFAYIELGSLGHWGEWHVLYEEGIRQLPPAKIREQYVLHYREAFPNTPLLMRRPFNIAKQLNLGLYNDMTGDPTATSSWLDWIANGGDYEQAQEAGALAPMPDAWRSAPVGGEQAPDLSSENLFGRNLERTLGLVEQSHVTFIGPNGPYEAARGGALQGGIDRVLARMGYRIYIRQVQMPRKVSSEKKLQLSITFANDGAAPMYYNWPVELVLFDAQGAALKTTRLSMDTRKIAPGRPIEVSFNLPLGFLENGVYTLGLAILDPHTGQPAVKLAMNNPRKDLIQELGRFEVRRLMK